MTFLGIAGDALGVAGASQGTLWSSLGTRRGRSGRRWGISGNALGAAGSRRGWSCRRWSLAGDALGVEGASGMFDFNSTLYQTAMLVLGFNASFTSMFHLGLDALLHFTSLFGWASDWAFSIDARGRDLSVSTCTGSFRWQNRWCPMEECLRSTASRMWCHHVIGRDGWEWGDQGAYYEVIPPTRWGKNP